MAVLLGKIMKSNAHLDYVCQIYGPHEIEVTPSPEDYAFGTFVGIELANTGMLTGIIYDTVLINPDFGRLGPRLSPESELNIFTPDYLNERAVLVGITVIGQVNNEQGIRQGVPPLSATSDALVYRLEDTDIIAFHNIQDRLSLAYIPLLMNGSPLSGHLARAVLAQLAILMPDQATMLNVIADDFAWQTQIIPVRRA